MAYKKFSKRRVGYRKRYNKSGAVSMARMALKGVSFLKSVLNPERKFLDVDSGGAVSIPQAGSVVYLSGMTTGDTINTRNGNSVKCIDHLFRATLALGATATVPCRVRVMLFTDKDNVGFAPGVTDVLQNTTTVSGMELSSQSGGRYHILTDRVYSLSSNTPSLALKFYKKLRHHLKYGGTTANVTDARSGAVFLLFLCDVATNNPTIAYNSRIKFYDN